MKFCSNCGASIKDGQKHCPQCSSPVDNVNNHVAPDTQKKIAEQTKHEKLMIVIGAVCVGIIIILMLITPIAEDIAKKAEVAAAEAKADDDRTIVPPKGSDLGLCGTWVDAISYEWTGNPSSKYVFKSDGTYTFQFTGQSGITTGKWGRLKGNHQLVTRRDSDTSKYSTGSPLQLHSSGKLLVDGFSLVRVS